MNNKTLTLLTILTLLISVFNVKICSAQNITQNLELYYKIDEGYGIRVYDSSTQNNHGTAYGGVTWTTGLIHTGLSFDGVDDTVKVDSTYPHLDGKDFTICGWFKPTPTAKYQFLWFKWWVNVFITSNLNGFVFELNDGEYKPVSVWIPVTNKWYFLVQVHHGSLHKAYVYDENGLVGTAERNDIGTTQSSDDHVFTISEYGWFGGENAYYQGLADEIRIYTRALSDDEINIIYRYRGLTSAETKTDYTLSYVMFFVLSIAVLLLSVLSFKIPLTAFIGFILSFAVIVMHITSLNDEPLMLSFAVATVFINVICMLFAVRRMM